MLSLRYFRHKIALSFILFSTCLSVLFGILIWLGIETSDDNAREALLNSHAERFIQYYEETDKLWARNQLSGIDILIEGRDPVPDEISTLPLGYFEDGEDDIYIYVTLLKALTLSATNKVFLVHQGAGNDWLKQYEFIILLLLVAVTIFVIIIGSIVGFILSRKISEPLQTLTRQIKSTDPNAPAFSPLKREDEFGEISDAFSNTLNLISEVLEREKQFSRYASHELRTPVAIINSSINLWKACVNEPDQEKAESLKLRAMERISAAAKQMEDVIQTFLVLGKEGTDWKAGKPTNLSSLLDNLLEKYKYLNGADHIHIEKEYIDTRINVTNDVAASLILSNVLRNAFDYCASEIHIKLDTTSLVISNDIDALRIDTSDHFGFGIKIIEDLCEMLNWTFRYEHSDSESEQGNFTIWLTF